MDQYQCRGKLLKNFQDHWSIGISPGKGMDQWPSKFSESFGLDRYWSIECSSLTVRTAQNYRPNFCIISAMYQPDSGNELPILTLPENVLGNFWLQSVCSI